MHDQEFDVPATGCNSQTLDRRVSDRYPCPLGTSCRLMAAVGDEFWTTPVRNISPGGISLVVHYPFEPGTLLTVELLDQTTQHFSPTLQVRVVYTVEHPSGDWILGGSFTQRLSQQSSATGAQLTAIVQHW